MLRVVLFGGMFILFFQPLFAQNTLKIDSLLSAFKLQKQDTLKVDLLFKIAEEYYLSSPEKAREYCLQAQKLSQKTNFKGGLAVAYGWLAFLDEQEGKIESAINYYKKATEIFKQTGNKKEIAVCLNNIGAIYKDLGKAEQALQYYEESLVLSKNLKDKSHIASTYNNIGFLYYSQGRIKEALLKYQEALKINLAYNRSENTAATLVNIGSIYKDQKQYKEALNYFERSLQINLKNQDKFSLVNIYNNIGSLYEQQKQYSLAIENFTKSLEIAKTIKDMKGTATALKNIGINYAEQNNQTKAKEFLSESLKNYSLLPDKWGMCITKLLLGKIFLNENDSIEAEKITLQSYQLAQELGYKADIRNASELLSQIYQRQGRWEQAFKMYEQFIANRDSLMNEETKKAAYKNQIQIEYDQKEAFIKAEQLKKEAEFQRQATRQFWLIVSALIAFISVSLIAFLVSRNNKKIKNAYKKLEIANTEISQQKEEISAQSEELKTTNQRLVELDQFKENMTAMIVHDLKNPLNSLLNISSDQPAALTTVKNKSIQMLHLVMNILDLQKFEDAKMILHLEDISLQNIVDKAIEQVDFLLKEKNLELIYQYSSLFWVKVDSEIIQRVLVNLLTNAIKFSPMNGVLTLKMYPENSAVIFSIQDQGRGIAEEELERVFQKFTQLEARDSSFTRSTGLGLTFCQMAVEAHQGKIGVKSTLGKGAEFWFSLEITKMANDTQNTDNQIITNSIQSKRILSQEAQQILQPFLPRFEQLEVYFSSELNQILDTINFNQNPSLKNWEKNMRQAIFTMNDAQYKQLLAELK